jgi:hypothetical protein
VHEESGQMQKEAVVAYFMVQTQNILEENNKNLTG